MATDRVKVTIEIAADLKHALLKELKKLAAAPQTGPVVIVVSDLKSPLLGLARDPEFDGAVERPVRFRPPCGLPAANSIHPRRVRGRDRRVPRHARRKRLVLAPRDQPRIGGFVKAIMDSFVEWLRGNAPAA
jgi:hypothetical protein